MAVPHFLRTFNVPLFIRLLYFIRSRLALVGINLYIHKATFLSLVKTTRSTAASVQVFLCQYVYKLTVWNICSVFYQPFSLQSAFANLPISHRSILLAFILLFSRAVAIAVSPLLFSLLGLPCHSSLLSAIFNSSRHFYCNAIFIATPFSLLPSILLLFSQQYCGFSFKAGP